MLVIRVSTVSVAFRDHGNERCRDPSRMWSIDARHTHADPLCLMEQMVSDGKTRSGKPYKNEYMFTFRFNAEGKILSVKEFLDSHYVLDILAGEKDAA